ncbi:MAG: 2,3-bisphosphoglycerate-independent phosphoglycerate mutase [bacterium]|nr:2,3-bisphosphoglycerate-independent phosphoglycerate mutase [bacterium]
MKFVCLLVLDGWGLASDGPGNAISLANIINMKKFRLSFPHTQLIASGDAVGLPRGEAGNTETGHLNLGAGRTVYQDLARINMAIAEGSFFSNKALNGAMIHAKNNNSNLHVMGLIGASGVHSNLEHLYALIQMAKIYKVRNLFLHLFTDGRDSAPTSSKTYIRSIREVLEKESVGKIASIMGRYWAMDRDRRWDRTEKAYMALTQGVGHLVKTPEEAIEYSYSMGKTDEFVEPSLISGADGKPIVLIKSNDSVIFFNFRIDRPRQLTAAFTANDFSDQSIVLDFDPYLERYEKTHLISKVAHYQKVFERKEKLSNLFFVTMTEYSKSLVKEGIHVAFEPETVSLPLGKVLSDAGLRQLRMSESEKERFVTYYFDGLRETPFTGEEKIIIPSPNVSTYDQKPEMSANELTESVLTQLRSDTVQSFFLVNLANPDMVGHTGNIGAAVKACETVDMCVGKIATSVLSRGGTLLITGDHGNVEEMINNSTGEIDTEHNANPVPFIAISNNFLGKPNTLPSGILADVAPTVLNLLNIPVPPIMTGRNLLENF